MLASGIIAVVRLTQPVSLEAAARTLAGAGVRAFEITLTTPGALDAIARLAGSASLGECLVGAGTVLDERSAEDVIAAGARFVVSPTLNPGVLRLCRDKDVVCMPGALTPTEILAAWHAGAQVVKLFPASAVGPRYLKDVLAPLEFLRIVPSGGVTLDNAGDWIRAGAAAVSVGTDLVNAATVREGAEAELAARARAFVDRVAEARRELAGGGRGGARRE
jgi:2-dehydro-3-deoxyphosphogluconate aldolase/(4S)-4-hydroxy-2-oxoglutarate aldolase